MANNKQIYLTNPSIDSNVVKKLREDDKILAVKIFDNLQKLQSYHDSRYKNIRDEVDGVAKPGL